MSVEMLTDTRSTNARRKLWTLVRRIKEYYLD